MMDIRKNVVTLGDAEKLMEIGDFDDLYLTKTLNFEVSPRQ
jgi:hypothetical protein